MIRNVLFDMGQVLIRWDPPLFVSRLGLDAEDSALLRREVFGNVEWVQLDRGSITEADALAAMCRRLPERLHGAAQTLMNTWDRERDTVPGMTELVKELTEKGYGVYLLSNAGVRHHSYWPNYPPAQYFGERVFISADHQLLKPEAAFYETALETFGLDRRACVFVDDNPANIEGALRVGLDALVFFGDAARLRRELREKGVEIAP